MTRGVRVVVAAFVSAGAGRLIKKYTYNIIIITSVVCMYRAPLLFRKQRRRPLTEYGLLAHDDRQKCALL